MATTNAAGQAEVPPRASDREDQSTDDLFHRGLVTPETLHALFEPDQVIVGTTKEGEPVAHWLVKCLQTTNTRRVELECLTCYSWPSNEAHRIEGVTIQIRLPRRGEGPFEISTLAAYPLRFDVTGTIKPALLERAGTFQQFRRFRKVTMVEYVVPTTKFNFQTTNPRYMIDMEAYEEQDGEDEDDGELIEGTLSNGDFKSNIKPPTNVLPLLFPPKIPGYNLRTGRWMALSVKYIKLVTWNKTALERMVMQVGKKRIIESAVRFHLGHQPPNPAPDHGNGLAILLHGPPGTGKTLTAEAVAELNERPLFFVSGDDLRNRHGNVEQHLDAVFQLASKWKAIIHLDECDLLLGRKGRDSARIAFVKTFKNYHGVLIVTTSRIDKGKLHHGLVHLFQVVADYLPPQGRACEFLFRALIDQLDEWQTQEGSGDHDVVDLEDLRDNLRDLSDTDEGYSGWQARRILLAAVQMALTRGESFSYYAHFIPARALEDDWQPEYMPQIDWPAM